MFTVFKYPGTSISTVIPFPTPPGSPAERSETAAKRVELVDRVATMKAAELKQITGLASDKISVDWINPDAGVGITHRVGMNVFRRMREGSRILQVDDVGVVSIPWIKASFTALTELKKRWGGGITLVWSLVRVEGRSGDNPEVAAAWRDMVSEGSPIERIIIVQNFEHLGSTAPEWNIDEPVQVVYPSTLDDVVDQVAEVHRTEGQSD